MSELEQPIRSTPRAHQCVCLLIHGGVNEDKCPQMVDDPDSPFCQFCEDSGHPTYPMQQAGRR